MPDSALTCTPEERHVLDSISCWPGVPAVVTFETDGTWRVTTRAEDIEARMDSLARK